MKIGFVMDPIELVNVEADTTFAFMLAAQARGHDVEYIETGGLGARGAEALATTRACRVKRKQGEHVALGEARREALSELDVVFMRKDPPFDVEYLHACQLLALAEEQGVVVVNAPRGLMAANEKLYTHYFAEVAPLTIVTRQLAEIRAFIKECGGKCILKPIDGHGGAGIFLLDEQDRNLNAILEVSTREGREAVICQRYVPEARQGDKRILLLDGEPLGAVLRVPQQNDNRGNMHVGGSAQRSELTARDKEICEAVAPRLKADGLYFVGLDVIGGYLTEVNVTSPTGIQEMSRFDGRDGAEAVIAWAENEASKR